MAVWSSTLLAKDINNDGGRLDGKVDFNPKTNLIKPIVERTREVDEGIRGLAIPRSRDNPFRDPRYYMEMGP